MAVDMSVTLCGVTLKNPVIAASGTFSFGQHHAQFIDINRLGGIALKSVTPEKRIGNKPPRVAETPSGMLNSVGLQNPGVDAFIRDELPEVEKLDTAVFVNVAGSRIEDYVAVIERLNDACFAFFELNISCPNVKLGGASLGTDPVSAARCVTAAKAVAKKPLIVKLTPAAGNIVAVAKAVQDAGADAVSLINTIPAMAVDLKTRRPVLGNVTGGLSGPCIKPVALKMVYDVSRSVSIPIIGMGGVMTGEDAAEFMLCGAAAVMVGAANLIDPTASLRIISELEAVTAGMKIDKITALTGALEV
jgi:dihydroorotate dehydrogenase (NAD+) catalytic subunit